MTVPLKKSWVCVMNCFYQGGVQSDSGCSEAELGGCGGVVVVAALLRVIFLNQQMRSS